MSDIKIRPFTLNDQLFQHEHPFLPYYTPRTSIFDRMSALDYALRKGNDCRAFFKQVFETDCFSLSFTFILQKNRERVPKKPGKPE